MCLPTMTPTPFRNAEHLDAFTEHMFNLYTSELSHRTDTNDSPMANETPQIPFMWEHDCTEICSPIIHDLVSAFLNPGTFCLFYVRSC